MAEKEYITKDAALKALCTAVHKREETPCRNQIVSCLWAGTRAQEYAESILAIPATDAEPVRHAYWVKRMEHGVGKGYEVHTPIWSCSNCGRDYDPVSCSIVKYCYICGAKMDGGQGSEEKKNRDPSNVDHIQEIAGKEEQKKCATSNADIVRAMTDEELAEFVTGMDMCELLCGPGPAYCKGRCEERCLEWLKKEVTNGRK